MTTDAIEEIKEETKKVSIHEFFFETGLYCQILSKDLEENIFEGTVVGFNSNRGIETTFDISNNNGSYTINSRNEICFYRTSGPDAQVNPHFSTFELTCRRTKDEFTFYLMITKDGFQKLGQYPSLADIQFAELGQKYDKAISKDLLKNFKKAIGLHSHGAGAGSFVYLRRIFESLIHEVFAEAIQSSLTLSEGDFQKLRMDEKVDAIKDYLPEDFSEMRGTYKVLSKGVHELTEVECMKYFPVLKISIELILEKRIEQLIKIERAKKTKQALSGAMKELSEIK